MNKLIIKEYINRLDKNDIFNFGLNNNIRLEDNELEVIYDCIKNKSDMIFNNPEETLREIYSKVKEDTYNKILELYNKYKNKIS